MPQAEEIKDAGTSLARQDSQLSLYGNIMFELRRRVEWIGHVLAGRTELEAHLAQEFCLLQLRFACELLALACLVAHGDIEETRTPKYRKQWHAAAILDGLERLNAAFFPVPVRQERALLQVEGAHVEGWHFAEVEEPFLKKPDITRLYGQLGEALHRGSVGRLAQSKARYAGRLEAIHRDANALIKLLSIHRMELVTGEQFICMLKDDSGQVSTFVGKRIGDASARLA